MDEGTTHCLGVLIPWGVLIPTDLPYPCTSRDSLFWADLLQAPWTGAFCTGLREAQFTLGLGPHCSSPSHRLSAILWALTGGQQEAASRAQEKDDKH